jgi:hypothetical protein
MKSSRALTSERSRLRPFTICMLLFILLISAASAVKENQDKTNKKKNNKSSKQQGAKTPTKVISLEESINRSQRNMQDPERAKVSREQWQRALKEIKELYLPPAKSTKPGTRGVGSFNRWKLLLDEPSKVELDPETNLTTAKVDTISSSTKLGKKKPQISRFEGFGSWERLMQDWADDVQEYLDKVEAESTNYPFSTHGKPDTTKKTSAESESSKADKDDVVVNGSVKDVALNKSAVAMSSSENKLQIQTTKNKPISLSVPAPVKDGEAVLPHTDIADKSKRIWIVTTAALPWMTGTAVNPLLRAAYMTEGRSEEGGSVTLMVPWLERRQDQDNVYGKGKQFDSPEDQEAHIRTWLRDKAKFPEAAEKLKIKWYTAWHSKVENSIYSMGDITALIPAEEVDIMILEEPEHLNW